MARPHGFAFPALAAACLLGLAACATTPPPAARSSAAAPATASEPPKEQFADLAVRAYQNNVLRNYADAETLYRRAFELRESQDPNQTWQLTDPLLALALQLSNQGRVAEADALFDRVDRFIAKSQADPNLLSFARIYRSQHEANQGRFQRALELVREGLPELERQAATAARLAGGPEGAGPLSLDERQRTFGGDLALATYLQARYRLELGDVAGAAADTARAERLAVAAPVLPRRFAPGITELKADLAERRGDLAMAETLQERALRDWEAAYRGSRPAALAALRLGRIQALRGHDEAALASYRSGVDAIRASRQSVSYEQLGGFLELLYRQGERDPAQREARHRELFEAAQVIRNSLTAQAIAMAAARIALKDENVGVPLRALQDAQRRRDLLSQRAAALLADESRAQDDTTRRLAREGRAAAEQGVRAAEREIAELQPKVDAALGRYGQLIDTPVGAADIAAAVRPDEALVDMIWGPKSGFVMLVRHNAVTAYPIAAGAETIDPLVARVRRAMELDGGYLQAFDVAASEALYKTLLGPAEADAAGAKTLILAPNGTMLSVPPGILVTSAGGARSGYDYSNVSWLVERSAVAVVPSARAMVDLRRGRGRAGAPKPFIGFGDFRPASPQVVAGQLATRGGKCVDDVASLGGLAELPETADEVRSIGRMVGGGQEAVVLGDRFTEKAVETLPLSEYRVLYFATHGLLAGELKCELEPSLVVTADPGVGSSGNSGLLEASEIADLKLDADLVVLSACNTGGPGNNGTGGESLSGLARSFLFAGARGLVVSHWTVPSEETATLMTATFADVGKDGTSGALRKAQLAMIAAGRAARGMPGRDREALAMHPFFWGGFAYVGAEVTPVAMAAVPGGS